MKKIISILAVMVLAGTVREAGAATPRPRPHIAAVRIGISHWHIGMQVHELPEHGVKTIETDDGIRFVYDGVSIRQFQRRKA